MPLTAAAAPHPFPNCALVVFIRTRLTLVPQAMDIGRVPHMLRTDREKWDQIIGLDNYMVTHQVGPNLLLISKQMLHFSTYMFLILKHNFYFDVNRTLGPTLWVTL